MLPIPNTEKIITSIKYNLKFLEELSYIDKFLSTYSLKEFIGLYKHINIELGKIELAEIESEFWQLCESPDEFIYYKNVFEIKFRFLLNWRTDFGPLYEGFDSTMKMENQRIKKKLLTKFGSIESSDLNTLKTNYLNANYTLLLIKIDLIEMFAQWDEMSPSNFIANLTLPPSKFRLAPNRKTDFLKIISSMYDARMFETEDGYIASSKQQLINEFGRLLNEDFSKYSAFLSQSKNVSEETFLKPFREIEQKAKDYFEK